MPKCQDVNTRSLSPSLSLRTGTERGKGCTLKGRVVYSLTLYLKAYACSQMNHDACISSILYICLLTMNDEVGNGGQPIEVPMERIVAFPYNLNFPLHYAWSFCRVKGPHLHTFGSLQLHTQISLCILTSFTFGVPSSPHLPVT